MFYKVGVFSILSLNITPCVVFSMQQVNDKRERRLPGLLLDGNSSNPDKWSELAKIRYNLKKLKYANPDVYNLLISNYNDALDKIKQYVEKKS